MNGLVVPKIPRTYMQRKLNIFFPAKYILAENYCGKQNIQQNIQLKLLTLNAPSFAELVKIMKEHLTPKSILAAENFRYP